MKLAIQVCPRCQNHNSPESKFCQRCGSALDIKTAVEADNRIGKAEEVWETLLRNPEVKVFLVEKLKQLNLSNSLA